MITQSEAFYKQFTIDRIGRQKSFYKSKCSSHAEPLEICSDSDWAKVCETLENYQRQKTVSCRRDPGQMRIVVSSAHKRETDKNLEIEQGNVELSSKIEQFLARVEKAKVENSQPLKQDKEKFAYGIVRKDKNEGKHLSQTERKTYSEKVLEAKKLMEEVSASQREAIEKIRKRKGKTAICKEEPKYPVPDFLIRMEKRREERTNRWNEIRQRKVEIEEEKERNQQRVEKEKLEAEKAAAKEQRKMMEEQKKKALSRIKLAETRGRTSLLKRTFQTWKRLLSLREAQARTADLFYKTKLLTNFFRRWKEKTDSRRRQKEERADIFFDTYLLRVYFRFWVGVCKERRKQYQVASDWNDLRLTEKYFKLWLRFALDEQLKYLNLKECADVFFSIKLKAKYLKMLRDYPKIKRVEISGAAWKLLWKRKIQEILPDYQSVCSIPEW